MNNKETFEDETIYEFDDDTVRDILNKKMKSEETAKSNKKVVRLKDWMKKDNNNSDITTFDL